MKELDLSVSFPESYPKEVSHPLVPALKLVCLKWLVLKLLNGWHYAPVASYIDLFTKLNEICIEKSEENN